MRSDLARARPVPALVLALSCGCSGEVAGGGTQPRPRADPPASAGAVEPTCTEVPAEAEAVLGSVCGFVVLPGDAWTLRSLTDGEPADDESRVPIPAVCTTRPCRLGGGTHGGTRWILAGVSSADSELVEDLWLVSAESGPVDLWVEPAVYGDGTWLGPAHELWPHACEGGVALLPRPRFDDGSEGTPAAETRGAAGWLTGEPSRPLPDRSACTALDLERPE